MEYAERRDPDPALAERLKNLARPSVGHWWEFVRRLVPVLAEGGDDGFREVRDLVLGRTRDDLPRAAGLDAALLGAEGGPAAARSTVRLTELFERMVSYRNREIGHGAAASGRRASTIAWPARSWPGCRKSLIDWTSSPVASSSTSMMSAGSRPATGWSTATS